MIGIIDMVPPYLVFFAIYAASLNPVLLLCIVISFVPSIVTLYMQRNIFIAMKIRQRRSDGISGLPEVPDRPCVYQGDEGAARWAVFLWEDENRTAAAV